MFTFGSHTDIYNPWSITNYLAKKQLYPYWAATSSNRLINQLLQKASGEMKTMMETLLDGKTITVNIDEQIVFEQLGQNENAVWSLLLAGGYLKAEHYMMLYAAESLEDIFHMALAWNVDGLIEITFKYQNYMKLKTLVNKPIVAIDLINKEKSDYVNVGLQDENGGYIMTKYLLEREYENIYVCARKNIGVDHERWLGYRKAWKEAGRDYLTNDFISLHETEQKRNQDYQMMTKYVGKKTALFFLADIFAVEAIHYFQEQGIRIPDDLGVAGFDGNIFGKYCYPRLTTVYQDVTEKGRTAVKLMIDLLENRLMSGLDVRQAVTLIEGRSV